MLFFQIKNSHKKPFFDVTHFLFPILFIPIYVSFPSSYIPENITELFLFQLLKSLFDKKNIKISSLLST